jgi:hypothetical protein
MMILPKGISSPSSPPFLFHSDGWAVNSGGLMLYYVLNTVHMDKRLKNIEKVTAENRSEINKAHAPPHPM